jgi:N-formylglutamate amidohydrolase
MSRAFALIALLLPLCVSLVAADAPAPKPADFVTVRKGTLPVIVSAPHGGRKKLPGVPERVGKGLTNFYTVLDANTAELAEAFAAELEKATGKKPWVVIARFERKYADVNRSPKEGYESEEAKPYYDAYHDALAAACKAVKKEFGRGLLLDIHGNGVHPGAICRGTRNLKTVTRLKEREGMPAVRGRNSVLGRMERLGYAVVPSPERDDDKAKEEPKFTGGYIVAAYGSHTEYGIDAMQLEFGTRLRTKDKYATTAKDLAEAVAAFYETYLKE